MFNFFFPQRQATGSRRKRAAHMRKEKQKHRVAVFPVAGKRGKSAHVATHAYAVRKRLALYYLHTNVIALAAGRISSSRRSPNKKGNRTLMKIIALISQQNLRPTGQGVSVWEYLIKKMFVISFLCSIRNGMEWNGRRVTGFHSHSRLLKIFRCA